MKFEGNIASLTILDYSMIIMINYIIVDNFHFHFCSTLFSLASIIYDDAF